MAGLDFSIVLAVFCLGAFAPPAISDSLAEEKSYAEARDRMVREQIERRGVRDRRVLEAIRKVPRHLFVRPELVGAAYLDTPLPTESRQTISQPFIVAFMTEAIRCDPSHRVLEIGTGSGYQAAILSHLVKQVYSVEIVPSLARGAADRLRKFGYANVQVREGDGWRGWPEFAPYDAILVTAAPEQVPPELVRQLKPGGRMILPLGEQGHQDLVLIEKDPSGRTSTRTLMSVAFVPLVKR